MTEAIEIVCDHDGGRLLPEGHRASKGYVWLDTWCREPSGAWTSLWEENVSAPHAPDAHAEHERTVVNLADVGAGGKLVDRGGRVRLRGGITRTKRGYRFECTTCPENAPVRNRTLLAALDAAVSAGRPEVTLVELRRAGAPAPAAT